MTLTRYPWTQPVCSSCLDPTRSSVIVAGDPEVQSCCFCGAETDSGISVRVDPETVPHPTAARD